MAHSGSAACARGVRGIVAWLRGPLRTALSALATPRPTAAAALFAALALTLGACSTREPAPVFDYTLLDGSVARSADLRGSVVMVSFWATTCAPCVREMPHVVATHQRFAGHGLTTLAVAMRHDAPARVADFAQQRQLPFGVVIDNMGAIAKAFGDVQATPTLVLIDKKGVVVKRWTGELDFQVVQAKLQELLAAG